MFVRAAVAVGFAQVALGKDQPLSHAGGHGYKSARQWIPREQVGSAPSAENLVADEALPANFDYRNLNGQNMVVTDWNQHIPQYCGACWIHGTLSALSDRIKLQRRGQFPDVRLGRQSIMNCVPDPTGQGPPPGCNGGEAAMILKYMYNTSVPDETCMPWQGENMGCTQDTVCRNCSPKAGCWGVPDFIGYRVSSYGFISGEKAMMKEIFARGPISCSFATDDQWMYNYSENALRHEGVYVTTQKKTADQIDHEMEIAGWGETASGRKYWVIRNSWGTYWGDGGWAKLERGVNALLSESQCAYGVPTWDGLEASLEGRTLGDYVHGQEPVAFFGHAWTPPQSASALPKGRGAVATAALVAFAGGIATAVVAARATSRRRIREPALLLG